MNYKENNEVNKFVSLFWLIIATLLINLYRYADFNTIEFYISFLAFIIMGWWWRK